MLPIDEDVFDVNANTREITVPLMFRNYGVSVQGDELAEVVYFRVDRFFDAMDLDTADIYIQWTTSDGISGFSRPWVVDIESEPNKMIIGWAISSKMTQKAGSIRFALRFIRWNDTKTELTYSLSTLTQTATIKSGLDFDLTDIENLLDDSDTADMIRGRIQQSKTQIVGLESAAMPIFIVDLPSIADLDEETGLFTLKVQANVTDAGILSYVWKEADTSLALQDNDDEDAFIHITTGFEPTTDEEPADKLYYKQITSDGVTAYTLFDIKGLDTEMGETPASVGLFEKFGYCTVGSTGLYSAIATNQKNNKNTSEATSNSCAILPPVVPTITKQIAPTVIVEKTGTTATLKVVVSNAEENPESRNGLLTYQWFKLKKANEAEQETDIVVDDKSYALVEGETESTLELAYAEDLSADEVEGFYLVKVLNTKNKVTTEVISDACRVSFAAEPPVLAYPVLPDANTSISISLSDPDATSLMYVLVDDEWLAQDNISDELQYQWYIVKGPAIDSDEAPENDKPDEIVENATQASLVPTISGARYYCKVTNLKNTTTATTTSGIFAITE